MSTPINDGGPAYPCHTNPLPGKLANAPQGMTLRDYFAGHVIASMVERDLRRFQRDSDSIYEDLTVFDDCGAWLDAAMESYAIADAMIEARKGGQGA